MLSLSVGGIQPCRNGISHDDGGSEPSSLRLGNVLYKRIPFPYNEERGGGHSNVGLYLKLSASSTSLEEQYTRSSSQAVYHHTPKYVVLKSFLIKESAIGQRECSIATTIQRIYQEKQLPPLTTPILGHAIVNSQIFIAMERMWGDFVHLSGELSFTMSDRIPTLLRYLKTAAINLASLHRLGVCHGDVKPDNILIGMMEPRTTQPLLFQQSVHDKTNTGSQHQTQNQHFSTSTSLHLSNHIVNPSSTVMWGDLSFASIEGKYRGACGGTASYMSPSRIMSRRHCCSRQDDIYAFAITVLVVLFGSSPLAGVQKLSPLEMKERRQSTTFVGGKRYVHDIIRLNAKRVDVYNALHQQHEMVVISNALQGMNPCTAVHLQHGLEKMAEALMDATIPSPPPGYNPVGNTSDKGCNAMYRHDNAWVEWIDFGVLVGIGAGFSNL